MKKKNVVALMMAAALVGTNCIVPVNVARAEEQAVPVESQEAEEAEVPEEVEVSEDTEEEILEEIIEEAVEEVSTVSSVQAVEATVEAEEAVTLAEGDVAVDEAHFPDAAFREYVNTNFAGGDGVLTQAEMDSVTAVYVPKGTVDVTGMEHFANLEKLFCNQASATLTSLDTSKYPKLTLLNCNGCTFGLNISQNAALERLYCENMGLTSVDFSNNPNLTSVYMKGNHLTELDASNLPKLKALYVGGSRLMNITGIEGRVSVDVNAANNSSRQETRVVTMNEDGTYDLKELYSEFDPSLICMSGIKISGTGRPATLEGTVLKDLYPGEEIYYDYVVAGQLYKNDHSGCLQIEIKVLGANSWEEEPSIADWTYGDEASVPTADPTYGEETDVVYTYASSPDGEFTAEVPTEAGTYYLKAYVPGTDTCGELETVVEFHINKAENGWKVVPEIKEWTEGETPNAPIGEAVHGEVKFLYSDSINGEYTTEVPTKAGTWYMKAYVEEDNNYLPLEVVAIFNINKKAAEKPDDGKPNGGGSSNEKPVDKNKTPQTGDPANAAALGMTMLASGAAALEMLRRKKK